MRQIESKKKEKKFRELKRKQVLSELENKQSVMVEWLYVCIEAR